MWTFLKTHKRYWLLPMLLVLGLFVVLLLAGQGEDAAFTYTLF